MDEFKDSVMIALLPVVSDWCKIELPHLTLVYAGEKDKLSPSAYNELAKDTASLAMLSRPLTLQVLAKEVFGDGIDSDPRVDVFRLRATSELMAMRNFVERWNASEHPFNPHVTIGPVGTPVENSPTYIAFDRIMIGWGKEVLTFLLNRGRSL